MSWDVSVFAANQPPAPVAQLPKDWRSEPMGTTEDVRGKISTTMPQVDWSDPAWGRYEGDGFSLEFNVGCADPCDGFMVHVRGGGGAAAVASLLQLAEQWQCYLLDCSHGEWLHHMPEPEAGWQGFQSYRDRILGQRDGAG